MNVPFDVVIIFAGAWVAGELYARVLDPLQERYHPDWTWLTVVGGVVLTWIVFLALAWRGYLAWTATAWYVTAFCATGAGIIRWQLRQRRDRLRLHRGAHGQIDARWRRDR